MNPNWKKWGYWRKQNYLFFKKELERMPDGISVLDLGAGRLHFKDLMLRFKKCAVDFHPYEGIDVVCDITKPLPFKNDSYEVVILSNVIEHISEPNDVLKECKRVLKSNGLLLGTVPLMMRVHQRPYDYYRYTDISLEYLLGKNGFSDIQIIPVLNLYSYFQRITASFFGYLIKETKFSENKIIQKIYVLLSEAIRLGFRITFKLFGFIFEKCSNSPDIPMGYMFKAKNNF